MMILDPKQAGQEKVYRPAHKNCINAACVDWHKSQVSTWLLAAL